MTQSTIRRVIADPLLHFLVAGLALFGLYAIANPPQAQESERSIIVTRDDLVTFMQYRTKVFDGRQFEDMFDSLGPEERIRLAEEYVREEAMYREAKALDLDRNDYVARKRLIQQLEFVAQDFVDPVTAVNDEALKTYYEAHRDRYVEPAKATFTHVFFSADRRGPEQAFEAAQAQLTELNEKAVPFHQAARYGDRALFNVNYVQKDKSVVASHFGQDAADAIFAMSPQPGVWRGPFRSPYGAHLVLMTDKSESHLPPLADVQARVAADALSDFRKQRLEEAVDEIVSSYDVKLEDDVTKQLVNTSS
ncbi:peptidyl-prolyl cis-trans isomerase [Henriciella litoralis]|uniref:peptidylprolyl isomerase n=1 Tax=Henriciella litoralis TaxID=568102 RepID=UPI000A0025A7|nr:peptidylprolyl isomerase [Henriciella litoralis]